MASENKKIIGSAGDVKFEMMDQSLTDEFRAHFTHYLQGLVRGNPGGFVLTPEYARNADKLRSFQPKADDVWVITFPKCGTTWTQELVWMVMNDCNQEAAKQPQILRSPFLEFSYLSPASPDEPEFNKLITLEMMENMPPPRIIKTHLPLYLLHPNLLDTSKVVYVVRNPKDVIVSFFHHHRLIKLHTYTGDLERFAQYFMDDELFYSPFFPHALEAWTQRHHPNMLFIFYEDMKKNLRREIEKVADFLGKKLSDEQMDRLVEHLSFEKLSKNEAVNYEESKKMGFCYEDGHFMRKGQTGDWRNHFSPELNQRVDEWIKKNLEGTDLNFVMELSAKQV